MRWKIAWISGLYRGDCIELVKCSEPPEHDQVTTEFTKHTNPLNNKSMKPLKGSFDFSKVLKIARTR